MSKIKTLPSFFIDDSDSMKIEEVIDYFISWTIRCADESYSSYKLVNQYSKMILSKIMFDNEKELEDKNIKNIVTWKQWMNIDVSGHLEIEGEKYVLIIENKMYSHIRDGQLSRYKKITENFYLDKPEFKKKFVFIRPDYEHENKYDERKICENQGYQYYNLEQLQAILPKKRTGNYLFDEFWFNWK